MLPSIFLLPYSTKKLIQFYPPPKKQQHFTLINSKGHCMATAMQRPLLFMFNH